MFKRRVREAIKVLFLSRTNFERDASYELPAIYQDVLSCVKKYKSCDKTPIDNKDSAKEMKDCV